MRRILVLLAVMALNHRRLALRMSGLIAVAAALLAITAAPAMAAPGTYTVSGTSGATFPLLTKHNLVKGAVDDSLFYLSTSGTGKKKLPFAIHFYKQTYKKMAISSNGNIQLGVSPGSGTVAFTNVCLPTATFATPVIMPFWDDLFFDSNDLSEPFTEGIFRKVSGTAPHRTFAINWQGHHLSDAGAHVLARVIFTEGSQEIRFVYGLNSGASATVGVQAANQAAYTQWTCNSGSTTAVQSGMMLTFTHSG